MAQSLSSSSKSMPNEHLSAHVKNIFNAFHFQNQRHVYKALTGSILDILDPKWHLGLRLRGDSAKPKDTVMEFVKVRSLVLNLR
jgi:hypothetical protein